MIVFLGLIIAGCGEDGNEHFGNVTSTPTATLLTSAAVLQRGPAQVGATTMTFVDTSRPTMPNGTYAGAPSRTLVTEIWYPTDIAPATGKPETRDAPLAAAGRPFPLVLYSHGFMSTRTGGAYLARHLASYGYIVAAADFPLTNGKAPGGPNVMDVVNQPADLSFIIDQLLALSGDPHDAFAAGIDAQRIGATGLSLGGETTYLVAFHPTLRDPRIRAAAPQAGPGCSFNGVFFDDLTIPLLIVHGDLDAIVPYQQNAVHVYGETHPPKYLVTLRRGTHTGFTDGIELFDAKNNIDDIGCGALHLNLPSDSSGNAFLDALGGAADGVVAGDCPLPCTDPTPRPTAMKPSRQHQLTILSVFPFFEAYLRGNESARQFLQHALPAENADVTEQFQP